MERVLDEISFTAPDQPGSTITIDSDYVREERWRPGAEYGSVAFYSLNRESSNPRLQQYVILETHLRRDQVTYRRGE
jgi:hypothetical protein